MDSYDEVHDVKNGREISTPDLDVSSAIRFVNNEDDDEKEASKSIRKMPEEVKSNKVQLVPDYTSILPVLG